MALAHNIEIRLRRIILAPGPDAEAYVKVWEPTNMLRNANSHERKDLEFYVAAADQYPDPLER